MNNRFIHYLVICLFVCLLIAGCQSGQEALIPVTGADVIPIPARVEQARNTALEYVISSARLDTLPPNADWQLDTTHRREGVYLFSNGDWQLIVRPANAQMANEHIVLHNQVTKDSWCGYVNSDGHVVDTTYRP
jgi:hypothetical protein